MEYVLKTNALSKKYRDFKALDSFSMNIPKGAIYGFVGKNGAGKTTLKGYMRTSRTYIRGIYALRKEKYGKGYYKGAQKNGRHRRNAVDIPRYDGGRKFKTAVPRSGYSFV